MQLLHDFEHMLVAQGRGDCDALDPQAEAAVQMYCVFAGTPMTGVTVDRRAFMAGLWELYGASAPELSDKDRRKAHKRHVAFYRDSLIAVCPDV